MTAKLVFLNVKYPSEILNKCKIDRYLSYDKSSFNNGSNGWKYIPADAKLGGV